MAADLEGDGGGRALDGVGDTESWRRLREDRAHTEKMKLTDVGCCVDDGGKEERDEEGHGGWTDGGTRQDVGGCDII